MQALLTRLDTWLAKKRPRFHKNLLPGASAGELAALEKSLRKPVPAQLQEWLRWHNGQGDDFVGYFEGHHLKAVSPLYACFQQTIKTTNAVRSNHFGHHTR